MTERCLIDLVFICIIIFNYELTGKSDWTFIHLWEEINRECIILHVKNVLFTFYCINKLDDFCCESHCINKNAIELKI